MGKNPGEMIDRFQDIRQSVLSSKPMTTKEPDEPPANGFQVTENALRDLQAAIEKSKLTNSASCPSSIEELTEKRFGTVYFGPVPPFAEGKSHFAMVSELRTNPRGKFRMAPITSKKRTGKMVMSLPPGTLPGKRGRNRIREITSYVILNWRARYSMEHLQERMEYCQRLPEKKIEEARKILRQA